MRKARAEVELCFFGFEWNSGVCCLCLCMCWIVLRTCVYFFVKYTHQNTLDCPSSETPRVRVFGFVCEV